MAPRRSRQTAAGTYESAPAATPGVPIESLTREVEEAISLWDSTGRESLQTILTQRLDDHLSDTPLSSILLSHTIIVLLASSLEAVQISAVISNLIDGLDEDVREDRVSGLGEALVDAVEVLEESQEDVKDLQGSQQAQQQMEVDGEKSQDQKAGAKGIEVVKILLDSSHLPPYIPNLLFTPENLLKVSLHPFPTVPQALQRAYVKRNTTLFFKQSKYNLLRESSEGFSALVVLLTSTDSLFPSAREESDPTRQKRARRVWSKVMGLIGYFNLSPPRVLDLILEVASCQVAAHWRFFLDLLKFSPWGREAYVDSGGKGKQKASENWLDTEVDGIAHSLDAGGDRVLSQVLGVKFGFYQRQDGGDTPNGLVYMAALLIKHGFVSLPDLLPFLSPDDSQMEKIRETWLKSINSRAGPSNALSNSVLLDEESPDASSKADDAGTPPKPSPEQRIILLQALLAVGHLPSALYLLSRFPWLAQRQPAIADLIIRIVGYALEDVYRATVARRFGDYDEDDLELQSLAPNATVNTSNITTTILAPPPPASKSKRFEFFYPEWADQLERWTSIDDIFNKGLRWLGLVRGLAGREIQVMVKICRVGAAHFAALRKEKEIQQSLINGAKTKEELRAVEPTAEEMKPWLDVIRVSLLPALSASSCTAAFDVELWHLLKYFPYPVRYALYGEWRDSTCKPSHRNACQIASHAAAESTRETKKALSRVTAAQTAPGGAPAQVDRGPARALAKLSHSNPHALWMTAVTQVKAYPNIGQFIVEAGRYMTQMSTDVAMFTLVDTLSDDTASRLNPNGTDVAQWLASLATFVGDFNRRYATMDLEPVLQFIINRLMRSESADLTILDKLISIMSGLSQVENDAISDDQLQAFATGKEMLNEAFNSTMIAIARPEVSDAAPGLKPVQPPAAPFDRAKSTKKSLPRLVNALRDTQLAMPIWIALAQTRQASVDKMASAPIKAMGTMQDTIHGTFIQYGELLAEQLSADEHIHLTPDLSSLVSEYGLDFAMAFQILRPRLNALLEKAKNEKEAAMRLKLAAAREEGLKLQSPSKENTPLPSPTSPHTRLPSEDGDVQMSEIGGETALVEGVSVPLPKLTSAIKSWYPSSLRPAMEHARDLLPPEANASMGAPFFVIFWHLTMTDIAFSSESYDKAIAKISSMERDVASWRIGNKSDIANERFRLKSRIELLNKEKEVQSSSVVATRRRLTRESKHWFGKMIVENNLSRKLSHQLHQHCFFPRSILTPADAVFVAKFIRMAHDLGTVGFSTIFVYSNFFGDNLAASIFSCTNNEARNFGRCLGTMLADLDAWHRDEKLFREEALGLEKNKDGKEGAGLPGMMVRSRADRPLAPMTWNQFREFYAKAHNALAKALVSCWAETDFMHIKNAITVGLQVIKYFPVMGTNGNDVENAVKDLIAGNNGTLTPDVQHQCQAYLRTLTQRQVARPYVTPSAFHASGQKSAPAKPAPTAPRTTAPSAAEAESAKSVNGDSTPVNKLSDPKALRAKLEENKATRASSAAASVKDEKKNAPTPPPAEVVKPTTPPPEVENQAAPVAPAGPRATRSSASAIPAAPIGPSTRSANMGPPPSSLEAERNAARARRFGVLAQPTPPSGPSSAVKAEPSPSPAPSGPVSTAADQRVNSPAPTSRRTSPAGRTRRSGSVESRVSERSRRDRRDRDDRERPRERGRDRDDRDRDAKRELLPSASKDRGSENGAGSRTPSERKGSHDESGDRKKQEDILQARADKIAGGEKADERRSSRDGGHRRASERDKEERKAKDRSDRNTRATDETSKRKRDEEAPRRIDDPRDRRDERYRDSRRDDRRSDRRDERDRVERPDDRDGRRHRDARDAPDPRDARHPRDARGTRDPRDARDRDHREPQLPPRDRDARRDLLPDQGPDRRERERDSRSRNVSAAEPNNGNRTPRRDERKELIPSGPEKIGDRIVEAPRPTTRASETSRAVSNGAANGAASRAPHALPARPQAGGRPPTPPRQSSLAERLGAPPPERKEAPETRSAAPSVADRLPEKPPVERDTRAASDPRKRPLDETGPPSREESPGSSKRVKIDRDKARGHDRKGREAAAGQNRLLANAMKGSGSGGAE